MITLTIIILCALVVYHHAVFPLILKMSHTAKRDASKGLASDYPQITLIVPAYNEAKYVADKIMNTASLNYPSGKLKLVIACDGCSDDTVRIARSTARLPEINGLKVEIRDFPVNRGKVALLNDVIALERAEIVALSDCSSMLSLDALKLTAEHFRYADVGVVGGAYHFDGCGDVSEEVYWSYQRAIKVGEARFGAPMGMHGAFYAFRRDLAEPLGLDTINDDFILPMKIVEKGFRAIYDEEIKCIETEPTSENMNWRRRIRISAGNVQQAINCFGLLSIKHPGISFCFFSGKFLRAWMPFILFLIPCLSFWASLESLFFGWFLIAQILGLIIVSLPVMSSGRIGKIHKTLQYLLVGHAAGFVGMTRYLTGLEKGAWKRAA